MTIGAFLVGMDMNERVNITDGDNYYRFNDSSAAIAHLSPDVLSKKLEMATYIDPKKLDGAETEYTFWALTSRRCANG